MLLSTHHGSTLVGWILSALLVTHTLPHALAGSLTSLIGIFPPSQRQPIHLEEQTVAGRSLWHFTEQDDPTGRLGQKVAHFRSPFNTQLISILMHTFEKSPHGVFLDVGMNSGFFSVLAATMGQETYAYEQQRFCFGLVALARTANGVTSNLHFRHVVVHKDQSLRLKVPPNGCYSAFKQPSEEATSDEVRSELLDNTIRGVRLSGRPVSIKITVDGQEPHVLTGAQKLLFGAEGGPTPDLRNVIMEISPILWKTHRVNVAEAVGQLRELSKRFNATYTLVDPSRVGGVVARRRVAGFYIYEVVDWDVLIRDRFKQKANCHLWFTNEDMSWAQM